MPCDYDSELIRLTQYLKYSVLFLIKGLILLLIQGGSLPSRVTITFEIRLLMMLRIFFVRMEAFSSVLLSKNALFQSKPWMALEIISLSACL